MSTVKINVFWRNGKTKNVLVWAPLKKIAVAYVSPAGATFAVSASLLCLVYYSPEIFICVWNENSRIMYVLLISFLDFGLREKRNE